MEQSASIDNNTITPNKNNNTKIEVQVETDDVAIEIPVHLHLATSNAMPQKEWQQPVMPPNDAPQAEPEDYTPEACVILKEPTPEEEDDSAYDTFRVTEARIELCQSHSFLTVAALLQSLNMGFSHTHFEPVAEEGWLFDEYVNDHFLITYCMGPAGRDQLRVRWVDPLAEASHGDDELPALTRRIARSMGGGSNLHLLDCIVRMKKPAY